MTVLVLTNVFFGVMADYGRRQERLAVNRASSQLARYFSPQLVTAILNGDRRVDLTTVRKEITVLFADLRGFTALTERLEPEELGRLLNEYLSEMTDVIFKYDGTLDKYIGDAVMAFFGDPVSHPDDPERAVRAAVEMRERFLRLRSTWTQEGHQTIHVGIGINTGYATVGNVGSAVRLEYTVIGSAVNVGSRLADAAKPGQILTTPRTLNAVKHLVEWRNLGAWELQGVSHGVDTVEILGLRLAARQDPGALQDEPRDVALSLAAEDPSFRAALLARPQEALQPYRLSPEDHRLVVQVVGLLGYPLFYRVPGRGVVEFVRQVRIEHFSEGTVVLSQGELSDRMYVISRGEVSVVQIGPDGGERHVATIGRGGFFGEQGVLRRAPRNATVRATMDLELYSLDAAGLREIEPVAPGLLDNVRGEAALREQQWGRGIHQADSMPHQPPAPPNVPGPSEPHPAPAT
jgi:class 3 adenylate cyclase